MNHRILGSIGMLLSPMLLLTLLISAEPRTSRFADAFALLFILGWMASVWGLRRLRATGSGARARVVFIVQLLGLCLAASQQVHDLSFQDSDGGSLFYLVADSAWPLSVLFMLVVGGMTIRTKVLKGWRRFAPLWCGLALPLLFLTNGVAGPEVGRVVFGGYTLVAWAALGAAVRAGGSEQV